MGFDGYADLVSHSAAVEEVHVLAGLLAQLVVEARGASVLLPAGLTRLAGEAAGRASVQRRLTEMAANAA